MYWGLCHCDGLYLRCFNTLDERETYALWNPSCRAYIEFWSPINYNDDEYDEPLHGIYYNPMIKDYEVVIADTKHYAIFSCRHNKWSEVKEMKGIPSSDEVIDGVSINGSFYWLGYKTVRFEFFEPEITCFGWKEKFRKLSLPVSKEKSEHWFHLTSSGGHLCLFKVNTLTYDRNAMSIWKKVNGDEKDSWVEFKVQPDPPCFTMPSPICWKSEVEIMLDINCKYYYLLNDQSKNTFVRIMKREFIEHEHPVLYRENLFLQ
ncbi:hypothetical protein ACS0TY_022140 [Phlomoides rotata]